MYWQEPLRGRIYGVANTCFFHLLQTGVGWSPFPEGKQVKESILAGYLDATIDEALETVHRWRQAYVALPLRSVEFEGEVAKITAANAAKNQAKNATEILRQCLAMAAEGPLYRGIAYEEANFASATGVTSEQMLCLAKHWPSIDSPALLSQYEAIELRKAEPSTLPIGALVASALDSALHYLLDTPIGYRRHERQAAVDFAWHRYIGADRAKAENAIRRWRIEHRNDIVTALAEAKLPAA